MLVAALPHARHTILVVLSLNIGQTAILLWIMGRVLRRGRSVEAELANLYEALTDDAARTRAAHLYAHLTDSPHVSRLRDAGHVQD